MIAVPVATDTLSHFGVSWWDTTHVETGVNPCDYDTRIRVTDEDGSAIVEISLENEAYV